MKPLFKIFLVVLVICVALYFIAKGSQTSATSGLPTATSKTGEAPSPTSDTPQGIEGLHQALAQHKGDVIYLDFWASWCGPCRQSFPWMNSIQAKYHNKGFTVISVNLDADYTLAQAFLAETPSNFSIVYDPKGKTAKQYKVRGMPTSYLIGRNGEIVKGHTGFFIDKITQYEDEIKQLLNE